MMYSMEFTTLAIKLNIIASILRSNLFDFSDAYIHVKGFITVPKIAGVDATVNDTNKNVMFKNCAPFTTHITEINNTHVDDPQVIDIILTLHNIIENNDAYVKTSGPIWQYSKPVLADNNNIIDFLANNNDTVSVKQLKMKKRTKRSISSNTIKNISSYFIDDDESIWSYFQSRPLSEILTIANLPHAVKCINRKGVIRAGKGVIKAGENF